MAEIWGRPSMRRPAFDVGELHRDEKQTSAADDGELSPRAEIKYDDRSHRSGSSEPQLQTTQTNEAPARLASVLARGPLRHGRNKAKMPEACHRLTGRPAGKGRWSPCRLGALPSGRLRLAGVSIFCLTSCYYLFLERRLIVVSSCVSPFNLPPWPRPPSKAAGESSN